MLDSQTWKYPRFSIKIRVKIWWSLLTQQAIMEEKKQKDRSTNFTLTWTNLYRNKGIKRSQPPVLHDIRFPLCKGERHNFECVIKTSHL